LEIYENQLTLLPHSFGQLTKLRTLGMGKNSLVELPDSINNIKNIESLWIDNFPKFANWIRQLTKLNEIRSIECQIQFVPDWLSELKLLRILTLIRNYTVNFT